MPRHCSVPGCTSNFVSKLASSKTVSTFSFPSDKELRIQWIRAISRKNWEPTKHSCVCMEHFYESQIVRKTNGRSLKYPKLIKNAVPCIFPSLPRYCSSSEPKSRQNPDIRRKKIELRLEEEKNDLLKADIIFNFSDFERNFNKKLDTNDWFFTKTSENIIFFKIQPDNNIVCDFTVRISISHDMITRIVVFNSEESSAELPKTCRLTLWSQMQKILNHYKSSQKQSSSSREFYLEKSVKYLEKASACETDFEHTDKLIFIIEQVKLLSQKRQRYSSSTILSAFSIFSQSPTAYNKLKNLVILPSPRHLQSLSSPSHNLTPDIKTQTNDKEYIRNILQNIKKEKFVQQQKLKEIKRSKQLCPENNELVSIEYSKSTSDEEADDGDKYELPVKKHLKRKREESKSLLKSNNSDKTHNLTNDHHNNDNSILQNNIEEEIQNDEEIQADNQQLQEEENKKYYLSVEPFLKLKTGQSSDQPIDFNYSEFEFLESDSEVP